MLINYLTPEVREACEVRKVAVSRLGRDAAEALHRCLSDIDSATSATEFLGLRPALVEHLPDLRVRLRLTERVALRLASGDPVTDGTSLLTDWSMVDRIRIETIEVAP